MLENFHLAAIIRQGDLLQIPLHQTLQNSLARDWQSQYDKFRDNASEIDFDAGYQPEEDECFCLADYDPPDWLGGANSDTVVTRDTISNREELIDSITGTVGFARKEDGEELTLFQNFTQSQIVRPQRFLLLQGNTYTHTERPGLTLDRKLSAVYLSAERKLLFRSFRTVNTFLPLTDFYKEASEQEIREILEHRRLSPEDSEALVAGANQWFRKRFAMLKDSSVLDHFSAKKIQSRSIGYDLSIEVLNGKIVFPSDKLAAKKLLQFLNEELFRGGITETLYETNSKRQVDKM